MILLIITLYISNNDDYVVCCALFDVYILFIKFGDLLKGWSSVDLKKLITLFSTRWINYNSEYVDLYALDLLAEAQRG